MQTRNPIRKAILVGGSLRRAVAVVLLIGVLAGCDDAINLTVEDHLQRAREFQTAGDLRSSAIELKNALQKDPNSAAARLLLGLIYTEIGDSVSAEKELTTALEAGADPRSVYVSLGEAWLWQGKFDQVLNEISFAPQDAPAYKAAVLVVHGNAQQALGQLDEAEKSYQAALQLSADMPRALVGMARHHQDKGELDKASEYLERALAVAPDDAFVIALQADTAYANNEFEISEDAYKRLIRSTPQRHTARLGLALAQIGGGKLDEAIANLDLVLKIAPSHIHANYLRALAAYRTKDYETAMARTDAVFSRAPAYEPALLLAGAAGFALNRDEQAVVRLKRYVALRPDNVEARQLLGTIQLRLGLAEDAVATLEPLTVENMDNAALLGAIGVAAVRSGDIATANRYLARAVELKPDDAEMRTRLGVTRVALGEFEQGLDELARAASIAPGEERIEATYIAYLLRAKLYDQALELTEKIQKEKPDRPHGFTMAGIIYTAKGDNAAARQAFGEALARLPGAPDASYGLARLAVSEGKPEEAAGIYQNSLEKFPDSLPILANLARLQARLGDADMVRELLERIVALRPGLLIPTVMLGRFHFLNGEPAKALSVTEEALRNNPTHPVLLEVVGRAQLALELNREAVATFTMLSQAAPSSSAAHYLLSMAYKAAGNIAGEADALGQALALDAGYVNAIAAMARNGIARGDTQTARSNITKLRGLGDETPEILDMEAAVAELENDLDRAEAILRKTDGIEPSNDRAFKIARILWRKGDTEAATEFLEQRLGAAADRDALLVIELSSFYQMAGRLKSASELLTDFVERWPDAWVGHNELAWVSLRMEDLEPAMRHAERAHDLAPENANVLDTFGMALLATGDDRKALNILRDAANRAPESLDVQYHFARALAVTGEREQAREVLTAILAQNTEFPERAEARTLLEEIGG